MVKVVMDGTSITAKARWLGLGLTARKPRKYAVSPAKNPCAAVVVTRPLALTVSTVLIDGTETLSTLNAHESATRRAIQAFVAAWKALPGKTPRSSAAFLITSSGWPRVTIPRRWRNPALSRTRTPRQVTSCPDTIPPGELAT